MTTLHIALRPSFVGPNARNGVRTHSVPKGLQGVGPSCDDAMRLADRILALDEPWRSRFVDLVAEQVGEQVPGEEVAWRDALMGWLMHHQVYRFIGAMVCTWTHETL